MKNGTVSLWYKDNKQDTVDNALAQTRAALETLGEEHEAFRIRLGTGAIALQQSVNDTVDVYQWIILAALNLVILFTCSLAYRSVAAGCLCGRRSLAATPWRGFTPARYRPWRV